MPVRSLKPDGQPVLALDLNELIRQVDYADSHQESSAEDHDNRIVVLCVDDSVMMRRTYEKRLASLNYDVVTAEDGEAALDYLAETTRPPDFVFTDLEMPNMNGLEACKRVKQNPRTKGIPIIICSSMSSKENVLTALNSGARDFIVKPVNDKDVFKNRVGKYLIDE